MCHCPENSPRSLTDLEGSDYLLYPLPHSERVKHLESWLREALVLPFAYEAEVDVDGRLVSFGQNLVEINERAVSVRKGQVGEARVRAEMRGVERLEKLLNQAEDGDLIFLFSPPGKAEEGFGAEGERRLSFSYVFEVKSGIGGSRKNIRAVAIPTTEISPEVQIEQFATTFGDALVQGLSSVGNEPVDRKLVATPVLVSGLTPDRKLAKLSEYTSKYVGKSWEEIELIIDNGLRIKEDVWAEQRRKSLINSISWQIRRYVDEQDGARLSNIGEAARVVLAREAVGHYWKMKPEELLNEYFKTESSMWIQLTYKQANANDKDRLERESGTMLMAATTHLLEVRNALMGDHSASGILAGSTCGGGGLGDALESLSGIRGGGMVVGRGHILEQQLASLRESSQHVGNEKMECVTCPFCSAIVDAILTPDTIKCPKCHKTASRG